MPPQPATAPPMDARIKNQKPASELLRLALPLMMQNGVPPTPRNYTIWYEYVAGNNEALVKAIDALTKEHELFSDEINTELYNTYIACDQEKEIEHLRAELQKMIHESEQHIVGATDEATRYQTRLEGHAAHLNRGLDSEKLLKVIDALSSETQEMVDNNSTLQTKLTNMTQELGNLRLQLEMVQSELMIDGLTGLVNRKSFDSMLQEAARECQNSSANLCLMMIDVDHFKRINDNYGHVVGDEVLRFIAVKMKEIIKGRDIVSRYGGEEFAIILPDTPFPGALHIAEELRKTIAASKLKRKSSQQTLDSVTISIGVAWYRLNEPLEEFVHRADRALYHAKRSGRNRVVDGEKL